MHAIDWKPDEKKLRQFGWISLAGFGLAGAVAWSRFASPGFALVLWAFAVTAPVVGMVAPRLLAPLFIGLSLLAFPIGFVVSFVVLGMIYFLLFTPIALFFRLTGRDALDRKLDKSATTYWNRREPDRPASDYYRQY